MSYTLVVRDQEKSVKFVTLVCVLHTRGVSSRKECEVCYFGVCLTHSWCELKKRVEVCYFAVCLTHSWCELKKRVKFVTMVCVLHTRGVSSRKE